MVVVIGGLLLAAFTAPAGAVVVRTAKGHALGLALHRGVSASALSGVSAPTPMSASAIFAAGSSVSYQGGPVVHSSASYLVFWDPNLRVAASSQGVLEQYLSDVAADSGQSTNVYAVLRQYYDTTGFADYKQTFTGSQAIIDTQPYPTTGQCSATDSVKYPTCLTDAQLQAELTRLISASSLPTGIGANAPVYFMVTPKDVNICADSGASECATNVFCAYHSAFQDGSSPVLYSSLPFIVWTVDTTKGCQSDGNPTYQTPTGPSGDEAYSLVSLLSHELSETITDPLPGTGWIDPSGPAGQGEVGDLCSLKFAPPLGGSGSSGTLYNQLINGHQYYTQSEWSNGDGTCRMQPSNGPLTAAFAIPPTSVVGAQVDFDPSGSNSTNGYSSETWNWGDGTSTTTTGAPVTTEHIYNDAGAFTVTLTVVDSVGGVSSVSHPVTIARPPNASFTAPTVVGVSAPAAFNASGSSDPNRGASITSYSWNFGDGTSSGGGSAPQHAYTAPGLYSVTLRVIDSLGFTSSATRQLTVAFAPRAVFSVSRSAVAVGAPLGLSAAASSDQNPNGSISGYLWNFGDGSPGGSGAVVTHSYRAAGLYTVTLTLTNAIGLSATASRQIPVAGQITKVARRGRTIAVTVSGPGTLKLGGQRRTISAAGTVKLRLPAHAHRITIIFRPLYGAPQRRTLHLP